MRFRIWTSNCKWRKRDETEHELRAGVFLGHQQVHHREVAAIPQGYIEPYTKSMSDVFWIRVECRDGDASRIILYRKKNARAGCGTMLWEGAVDESQYPVSISLWFNRRDYRIQIDKPFDSISGSRPGRHELYPELWSRPVRFGLKSVHGTQPANALIRQVRIAPGGP